MGEGGQDRTQWTQNNKETIGFEITVGHVIKAFLYFQDMGGGGYDRGHIGHRKKDSMNFQIIEGHSDIILVFFLSIFLDMDEREIKTQDTEGHRDLLRVLFDTDRTWEEELRTQDIILDTVSTHKQKLERVYQRNIVKIIPLLNLLSQSSFYWPFQRDRNS